MCRSYRKVVGGDSVTTPSIRLFAGLERELWEGPEIGSEGGLCMCRSYRKVVGGDSVTTPSIRLFAAPKLKLQHSLEVLRS